MKLFPDGLDNDRHSPVFYPGGGGVDDATIGKMTYDHRSLEKNPTQGQNEAARAVITRILDREKGKGIKENSGGVRPLLMGLQTSRRIEVGRNG